MKSAGRALEIFEFFAHRHAPATVSEVAAALGFPLSSASVLLRSLRTLGYLDQDARTREYTPTIRLAVLGSWIYERSFAGESGIPRLMDELQRETGETIVLAMQHGIHVDYIRILLPLKPVRFGIRPGSRRPIHRPAAGKVLLAAQPDDAVTAVLRRANAARGADPVVPARAFLAEMARIRRDGFAVSEASVVPGTAMLAMALPVTPGHRPLAIAVSGPLGRMRRRIPALARLLRGKLEAIAPPHP